MKFKAVLFDLVGTTVIEKPGTIIGCFDDAFKANNVEIDMDFLLSHRGRGEEIIESLLKHAEFLRKQLLRCMMISGAMLCHVYLIFLLLPALTKYFIM